MRPTTLRSALGGCLVFALSAGASLLSEPVHAQSSPSYVLSPLNVRPTAMSASLAEVARTSARPMERTIDPRTATGPTAARTAVATAPEAGPMMISPGFAGRAVRSMVDEAEYRALTEAAMAGSGDNSPISEQNYGSGLYNTPYHYNDYLQFPSPYYAPYRSIGWLNFQASDGGWYWCTAALIDRAILVTAGHCVFDGGANDPSGWNLDGYFYPGYSAADGANQRYGRCRVLQWGTTWDWYTTGALNGGYDVGVAVCGRLENARWSYVNNYLPGGRVGYLAFCYLNCRPPYWFNSQYGYPSNYYSGGEMTVSQHLEITRQEIPNWAPNVGLDFVFGSGMLGGSSGGPHISNVGDLSDSAANQGQYTDRNVIMAVTSWGFTSNTSLKIQGASPLSGVDNANDFRSMFNAMCYTSRQTYGTWSCTFLP